MRAFILNLGPFFGVIRDHESSVGKGSSRMTSPAAELYRLA